MITVSLCLNEEQSCLFQLRQPVEARLNVGNVFLLLSLVNIDLSHPKIGHPVDSSPESVCETGDELGDGMFVVQLLCGFVQFIDESGFLDHQVSLRHFLQSKACNKVGIKDMAKKVAKEF